MIKGMGNPGSGFKNSFFIFLIMFRLSLGASLVAQIVRNLSAALETRL